MVGTASEALEAISLLTVALVAFILNGITVAVFCNRPALRSPSNRFVLSLIGANFVSTLTLTPIFVGILFLKDAPSYLRTASIFTETTAVIASVFSTLSISLDRYNAVISPLHYTINITRQRSRCLIALIWLFAACLSVPTLCRRRECLPEYDYTLLAVYSAVLFVLCFIVPLATLCRVYVKMYAAAHRNSERTRRQSIQTSAGDGSRNNSVDSQFPPVVTAADLMRIGKTPTLAQLNRSRCSNSSISALLFREEGRAVKTAALVIATFIISWGPFFIFLLYDVFVEELSASLEFFTVLATLLSAVLSPFLYVYRNEMARNEGLRILLWWRQKGLYRGNVLQQACKEIDVKAIESGIRVRHQTSSNCDSVSVQSFSLPPALFSPDCKQCAEIPQPPVADFVATYEIQEKDETVLEEVDNKSKTRGESVTFRLATLPQRKCGMCSRQNSDSSSGSGYPLLRDTDSPSISGRRYDRFEQLSRGSSFEDSPTFRGSPGRLPPSLELDETQSPNQIIFQFSNVSKEKRPMSENLENEGPLNPQRQDSEGTLDSGVEMDRSHSSSSSLSMASPVISRTRRHSHKLQRLAAVEDEETSSIHRTGLKLLPCDFG